MQKEAALAAQPARLSPRLLQGSLHTLKAQRLPQRDACSCKAG